MIFICGPNNSRYTRTGSRCPHLDVAIRSTATTLGEAIAEYQRHFGVSIQPMNASFDGRSESLGRYWSYADPRTNRSQIVEVCIIRAGDNLYFKHDTDAALKVDDIVEFQELIGALNRTAATSDG